MIRGLVHAVLATVFAVGTPSAASAGRIDVTISTAPTHDMVLVGGVYSPTGDRAVLNANDLMTALNAGNLEVTTGSGRGKESGDIVVGAAFHWASAYGLTLDAFHSIRVDAPVTDAGTGALTVTTDDGGNGGHLQFGSGGNISFWGLSNALTINGQPYTLVNSVASLAAAITANLNGNYALAASYDASVDKTYKQDPIATTFNGNFEGLGNAVSNISIRAESGGNEGFFSEIGTGASVSNFRLRNATVIQPDSKNQPPANVMGGLVGSSLGTLYGDDVSGVMRFMNLYEVGGLIGEGVGSITQCSSSVAMKSNEKGYGAGSVGGLSGSFTGTITDSLASGNVSAGENTKAAGGLVGMASGAIRHSHATGNVSGRNSGQGSLGGLVGVSQSVISDSYAMGDVTGGAWVGGLVGTAVANISGSFATGRVGGTEGDTMLAGGIVGYLETAIQGGGSTSVTNSYATGAVSGAFLIGGLMGEPFANISIIGSYATGKITNQNASGGIAGDSCSPLANDQIPCFSNDYWDITTSGTTVGVGRGNAEGITGLTTTQLKAGLPAGFDPKIWAEDRKINHGLPYLIANPPP